MRCEPIPAVLRPLMSPIAALYARAIRRRNARFDRGVGVRRAGCPVISVGNLAVGGVGKTPLVRWLVNRLAVMGARPIIALRGYGERNGQRSDEAEEYGVLLEGIPVLTGADRFASIEAFLRGAPDARRRMPTTRSMHWTGDCFRALRPSQ